MTPQDVLTITRDIIADVDPTNYRQSNDELLRYLNEAIGLAMAVRPEFFYVTTTHSCAAGAAQALAAASALVEVQGITGGARLTRMNKPALDAFKPAWVSGTAGAAQQWDRDMNDALKFWVYPPATAGQSLDVKILPTPPSYVSANLNETMTAPDWMKVALSSFVAGRAETKDDEHVNSGRAVAMNAQFADALKAGVGT
jgi:hypothetical protein